MQPFFSIIIPSYNKEKYFSETISSVLKQTYTSFELIIVDDCSTDQTLRIVREFMAKDDRILLFEMEANKGANYCRNFGLKRSNGKYILFLDADDVLEPFCLEERMKLAKQYNDKNLLVFTLGMFNKKIGDDARIWNPVTNTPLKDFLRHKLPWQTMQPIWKREFITSLNGFDEQFMRLQDVELHTRALLDKSVNVIQFNNKPDCYFRIDEERLNFNVVNYLSRWVNSTVLYFNKFYSVLNGNKLQKQLWGTIYKTFTQLHYYYKLKKINRNEYYELKQRLFQLSPTTKIQTHKKVIFALAESFNLFPVRIPGFNWLFSNAITAF